jgi:hypothetical protein
VPDVLYPRLFGVAWSEIDSALQRVHCNCEPVHAAGVFRISHGTSLGAKLLLLFLRLPPPNAAAQVELIVRPVGESETWLRLFDGKPVVTVQREPVSGLLAERFGPIEFRFRLSFADQTIHYRQVGVILRFALPFFQRFPCQDGRLRMFPRGRRPGRARVKLVSKWKYPYQLRVC